MYGRALNEKRFDESLSIALISDVRHIDQESLELTRNTQLDIKFIP